MEAIAQEVKAIRTIAFICIVESIFGTVMGYYAVVSLQGWGGYLPWIPLLVGGALLLFASVRLMRQAMHLPNQQTIFASKQARRRYIGVATLTYLIFLIGILVLSYTHHTIYAAPWGAIVIGLHFIAIRPFFHSIHLYITALVYCLTAILTILFVPNIIHIGSTQILGWILTIGLICGLWLWGSVLRLLLSNRHYLQKSPALS